MATIRSDQQSSGRYVHGGSVEVVGDHLGWWERTIFPRSESDVPVIVTAKYVGRPDLLAYDMYGKANLAWFVLQYNNISDVTEEFVQGANLVLPTVGRLLGELLTKSRT